MTAVPLIATVLGVTFDSMTGRLVGSGILIILAGVNIYGVRLTARINTLAVCAEIVSLLCLGGFVAYAAMRHGQFDLRLITTIPDNPKPYLPGFLMAFLLGAWGIVGFETAAEMSEETVNARQVAPKGVLYSTIVACVIGFLVLIAITASIPNVEAIASADNPLIAIATAQIGGTATTIFVIFVIVAILSCSLMCITSIPRVLYAMARDNRFIASSFFQRVSAHHVPVRATWCITLAAIACTLLSDSLETLFAATAILPALIYLITVISFAVGSSKLDKSTTFSLGGGRPIIVFLAISWLLFEIAVLTIPQEFHAAAYASGAVVLVGIVIFVSVGRKRSLA